MGISNDSPFFFFVIMLYDMISLFKAINSELQINNIYSILNILFQITNVWIFDYQLFEALY